MIYVTVGLGFWVCMFLAVYCAGVCLQNRQRRVDDYREERRRAIAQGLPDPLTQRFLYNPVGWVLRRPASAMVTVLAFAGFLTFLLVLQML